MTHYYARQEASGQARYFKSEKEAEKWAFTLPMKNEQVDIYKWTTDNGWVWLSCQILIHFPPN